MKVTVSSLLLPGALLGQDNPLPKFMSKNRQMPFRDSGLLDEEKEGFAYETGFRVLPYLMQDNYTRKKEQVELKTVILENDVLRATFLPEYGARLYSLYNKKTQRELLYVNPVFQPANLAIRNAWFSGGIEWNIGHYGHTFLTMSDYFAVVCKGENGCEFLRFYEYERCKRFFLQMDFHLNPGSDYLVAHVKIQNTRNEAVPMYWWTNIAVPEKDNVRIFSGTEDVIYIKQEPLNEKVPSYGFAHGKMPYLDSLKGLDASYPGNFLFSNEFFFQNDENVEKTWEAACYDDGNVFFERSTKQLRYRKMFCWGNHKGGKRWKEFLSGKDTGEYVEIQAGMARTQVHGFDLGANGVLSFTQIFGSTQSTSGDFYGDWKMSSDLVYNLINEKVSTIDLELLDDQCKKEAECRSELFVHLGSGWGALEALISPDKNPLHLYFPTDTIGEAQKPWLNLLTKRSLQIDEQLPWHISYMTDPNWLKLIEDSETSCPAEKALTNVLLGIGQWENGKYIEAVQSVERSLNTFETPFALRCMAMLHRANCDPDKSMRFMQRAVESFEGKIPHKSFAEEYIQIAIENDEDQKAWDFYESLDDSFKEEERVILLVAPAALKLDKREFLSKQFSKEFAVTREGENILADIYKEFMLKLHEETNGIQLDGTSKKAFLDKVEIPWNIDFRMN